MNFYLLFLFTIILAITFTPSFLENSFAKEITIHQQWKEFGDIDLLTCKSGYLLLQKNNDNPTCVLPFTYLKLVDRGYGSHNQSIMEQNPEMMTLLMNNIASNPNVMFHCHEMIQNNSIQATNTMTDWISQMIENPELLKNMLSPITNDPALREKMIEIMKNHPYMENSLKQNSEWMDSIHNPMKNSGMGQCLHNSECILCTNPSHIRYMSEQMMEPMLNAVMDDADLQEQMIEFMLQHQDFMNSIRHNNPESNH